MLDVDGLVERHTRPELVTVAGEIGIDVRRSWTKRQLAEAIIATGVDLGPADLGPAGRRLWRDLHRWLDDEDIDLDPHELVLVAELARTADRLTTIRAALAHTDPTSAAWTRLASEERQRGLAMARLISSIGFPTGLFEEGDAKGASPRSRRAQTAAQQRWSARIAGRAG